MIFCDAASKIRVDFKAVHVIIKTLIFVNFISFRN